MTLTKPDFNKPFFKMFPEKRKMVEDGRCMDCGKKRVEEKDFKDDLSKKEYSISGMCQVCQDKVWR